MIDRSDDDVYVSRIMLKENIQIEKFGKFWKFRKLERNLIILYLMYIKIK